MSSVLRGLRWMAILVVGVLGGPLLGAGSARAADLSVGAAKADITPTFYPHGDAPLPAANALSACRTPAGISPQAYFNGKRYFDFEDLYHVESGSPPDEYDPNALGGVGEPFCKLSPAPFNDPEYGHTVNPAGRYEGMYLAGGSASDRVAKAILPNDHLGAQAVVFQRGSQRVALVAVDSIGTFRSDFDRIRHLVAQEHPELAGMQIVISSTHNESAPDPIGIWGPTATTPGVNHLYMDFFVSKVASAIEQAAAQARPAQLAITEAPDPSNFLSCFSSYPFLPDHQVHLLQARDASDPAHAIATILEYGIHNEDLGFSGTPPNYGAMAPPDANDPRGYYSRVMAADWTGYFRSDVEASVGGVAMAMVGPNGSVEMPVVYPPGTRVSRTPSVGPGAHAPATNDDQALGDCGRTVEQPPAGVAPQTIDQLKRAQLIAQYLHDDALGALHGAPISHDDSLSAATSPDLDLPLTDNREFLAAGDSGLFPDRPIYTDTPAGPKPTTSGGNAITTQVSVVRIADAQMITLPGETFPQTTIRGPFGPGDMAFDGQPMTPWLSAEMSAPHRFYLGLSQDMVGYLMPPGNFVGGCVQDDMMGHCLATESTNNPWRTWQLSTKNSDNDRFGQHHSDDSEAVGPFADLTAARATEALLQTTPDACAQILDGRYIDADGTLDRSPLHGAVGVWVLPAGSTAFTTGAGQLYLFAGAQPPPGVSFDATASAVMDYNGRATSTVDQTAAGVLVAGGCAGADRRVYTSVYDDLGGATNARAAGPRTGVGGSDTGAAGVASVVLGGGVTLRLPSPQACFSRRLITLHLARRHGVRLLSVSVTVGARRVRVHLGRGLHTSVTLRGLPGARLSLGVVARLRVHGRLVILRARRLYRACAGPARRAHRPAAAQRHARHHRQQRAPRPNRGRRITIR